MLLSTTATLQGCEITSYLGIVSGETIIGANALRDFAAGLTDFFGGRSTEYEDVLKHGKGQSIAEMKAAASDMGANAIIGIDIDYESMNGMLIVVATGTAVVYR